MLRNVIVGLATPLLLFLLLSGCAHTVEYDLTAKDKVKCPKINKVVAVEKFSDQVPEKTAGIIKINGQSWRTNPERGYTGSDRAFSVTAMIAKHLDYSGLFKDVIYEGGFDDIEYTPANAQLILTGTLAEYLVMGRVNKSAETKKTASNFFGLLGMAASAVANVYENTEIRVKITLKDVTLKDAKTGRVLWKDTISVTRQYKTDYEQAGARAVYDNADACLKETVSELIRRMSNKLEKARANHNNYNIHKN